MEPKLAFTHVIRRMAKDESIVANRKDKVKQELVTWLGFLKAEKN
jgi:hypothetical protein